MKNLKLSLFTAWLFTCSMVLAKPIDLQMGARAFGMGGAFSAISNDGSAAYWNPAGLATIGDITLSESNWIFSEVDNVNVNYFSGIVPISNVGTIAGGWLLQQATLEQGNGDTFKETEYNENAFSLSAGRQLWEQLWIFHNTSVGFSLNRHLIDAESDNGAGTGFDIGFLTYFPYQISFAFVAKSLATDMMGDKIDPEYRTGLGYTWARDHHQVVVATDLLFKQNIEYEWDVNEVDDFLGGNHKAFGGVEYQVSDAQWSAALRMGFNRIFNSERENTVVTGGFGGTYSGVSLQYAFQTNTEKDLSIGNTHRITLELQLSSFLKGVDKIKGKSSKESEPEPTPEPTPEPIPVEEPVMVPEEQPEVEQDTSLVPQGEESSSETLPAVEPATEVAPVVSEPAPKPEVEPATPPTVEPTPAAEPEQKKPTATE